MSSILKALKKLEEEKLTPDDEPRRGKVSSDILRQPREKRANSRLLLGIAIIGVLIVILLITLLLRPAPKEASLPAPAATVPPVPAPSAGQQPLPASVPEVQKAPLLPAQPAMPLPATGAKAARPLPQETVSLPEPARAPVTRKFPLPELPGSEPLPAQAVPPKQLPKPPAQTVENSEPRLTLSGIAWNKDSAERIAIINGQPASTGSHIGGAVVEEILPDRVRLSSKGRVFELSIGRSGN
ncbi:MAG: hypothetical protein FIA91_12630 [Geobacter sp.]|nr:hypothetical protein [Geobacter sp.]